MKRLFSKCIAVLMASSLCITAFPSAAFASNTPSSWAANSVNNVIAYGLVPEEVQGRYQDNITREEFAILLDEVCDDYSGGRQSFVSWKGFNTDEYAADGSPFTDTQNRAVKRMYCAGVMSGIGNGKFGANDPLTREQAATMISNLFDFCSKSLASSNVTFDDSGSISSWAKDSVGKVQAAGIMSGVGYNQFAPKQYYTREQAIVTALKTYDALVNGPASNTSATGDVNLDYVYLALDYIYPRLKFPSTMEILSVRAGEYDRVKNYEGAPDWAKPTGGVLSMNDDYYVVAVTYRAANSLGQLVTDTCVCLYDRTTGKTINDMESWAESGADGAWGASKSNWLSIKSEASLLAAKQFDEVDRDEVQRLFEEVVKAHS